MHRMITMHAHPRQTDGHHGNNATIRSITNASRAKTSHDAFVDVVGV